MACDLSFFEISEFSVIAYPPGSKVGCNLYVGQPTGCMKPGDTVQLSATIGTMDLGCYCTCATVKFSDNGTEIGRQEVCVGGTVWRAWSVVEVTKVYVIPSYGAHNFCAEIASVR